MDVELKQRFERLWEKYFDGAELPITFFYATEKPQGAQMPKPVAPGGHRCIVGDLAKARQGKDVAFNADTIGCGGGKRYLGYTQEMAAGFEYFLSYGVPGKVEGERYKKSPELVKEIMKKQPAITAPGPFIVFKRWDRLTGADTPEAVIFFATPDVLSGIFTLANYDEVGNDAVAAPFGAGCSTIILHPYIENKSRNPRAFIGMLDVSARPCVPADVVTISVPMKKVVTMIGNMEESFLITGSWKKVRRRITMAKPGK
jgi:hypothetical protein